MANWFQPEIAAADRHFVFAVIQRRCASLHLAFAGDCCKHGFLQGTKAALLHDLRIVLGRQCLGDLSKKGVHFGLTTKILTQPVGKTGIGESG